jgi:hypothetical protein
MGNEHASALVLVRITVPSSVPTAPFRPAVDENCEARQSGAANEGAGDPSFPPSVRTPATNA